MTASARSLGIACAGEVVFAHAFPSRAGSGNVGRSAGRRVLHHPEGCAALEQTAAGGSAR